VWPEVPIVRTRDSMARALSGTFVDAVVARGHLKLDKRAGKLAGKHTIELIARRDGGLTWKSRRWPPDSFSLRQRAEAEIEIAIGTPEGTLLLVVEWGRP